MEATLIRPQRSRKKQRTPSPEPEPSPDIIQSPVFSPPLDVKQPETSLDHVHTSSDVVTNTSSSVNSISSPVIVQEHSSTSTLPTTNITRSLSELEAILLPEASPLHISSHVPVYNFDTLSVDFEGEIPQLVYAQEADAPPLEDFLMEGHIVDVSNQLYDQKLHIVKESQLVSELSSTLDSILSKNPPSTITSHPFYILLRSFEGCFNEYQKGWSELAQFTNNLQQIFNNSWKKVGSKSVASARCSCRYTTKITRNFSHFVIDNDNLAVLSRNLNEITAAFQFQFLLRKHYMVKSRYLVENFLQNLLVSSHPFSRNIETYSNYLPNFEVDYALESTVDSVFDCLAIILSFVKKYFPLDPSLIESLPVSDNFGPITSLIFGNQMLPYPSAIPIPNNSPNYFLRSLYFYLFYTIQKLITSAHLNAQIKMIGNLMTVPGILSFSQSVITFPLTSLDLNSGISTEESTHVFSLLNLCFQLIQLKIKDQNWSIYESDLIVFLERIPLGSSINNLIDQSKHDINQFNHLMTFTAHLVDTINDMFKILIINNGSNLMSSFSQILVNISYSIAFFNNSDSNQILYQIFEVLFFYPVCWNFLPSLPFEKLDKKNLLKILKLIITSDSALEIDSNSINSVEDWSKLDLFYQPSTFSNHRVEFLISCLFSITSLNFPLCSLLSLSSIFHIIFFLSPSPSLYSSSFSLLTDLLSDSPGFIVFCLDFVINQMSKLPVSSLIDLIRALPRLDRLTPYRSYLDHFFNQSDWSLALSFIDRLDHVNFPSSERSSYAIFLLLHLPSLYKSVPAALLSVIKSNSMFSIAKGLKSMSSSIFVVSLIKIAKILSSLFVPNRNILFENFKNPGPSLGYTNPFAEDEILQIIQIFEEILGGKFSSTALFSLNILSLPLLSILPLVPSLSTSITDYSVQQITSGDYHSLLVALDMTEISMNILMLFLASNRSSFSANISSLFFDSLSDSNLVLFALFCFSQNLGSIFDSIIKNERLLKTPSFLKFLNYSSLMALYNSIYYDILINSFKNFFSSFDTYSNSLVFPRSKIFAKHKKFKLINFPYFWYFLLESQYIHVELPNIQQIFQDLSLISNSKFSFLNPRNAGLAKTMQLLVFFRTIDATSSLAGKFPHLICCFLSLFLRQFLNNLGQSLLYKISQTNQLIENLVDKISNSDFLRIGSEAELIQSLVQNCRSFSDPSTISELLGAISLHNLSCCQSFYLESIRKLIGVPRGQLTSQEHPIPSSSSLIASKRANMIRLSSQLPPPPPLFINQCHLARPFFIPSDLDTSKGSLLISDLLSQLCSQVSLLTGTIKAVESTNSKFLNEILPRMYTSSNVTVPVSSTCRCGLPVSTVVNIVESKLNDDVISELIANRRVVSDLFDKLSTIESISRLFVYLDLLCKSLSTKSIKSVSSSVGVQLTQSFLSHISFFSSSSSIFYNDYFSLVSSFLSIFGSHPDILSSVHHQLVTSTSSNPAFTYLLSNFSPHLFPSLFSSLYLSTCQCSPTVRSLILSRFDATSFVSTADSSSLFSCLAAVSKFVDRLDEPFHKELLNLTMNSLFNKEEISQILNQILSFSELSRTVFSCFVSIFASFSSISKNMIPLSHVISRYFNSILSSSNYPLVKILDAGIVGLFCDLIFQLFTIFLKNRTLNYSTDLKTLFVNCFACFFIHFPVLDNKSTNNLLFSVFSVVSRVLELLDDQSNLIFLSFVIESVKNGPPCLLLSLLATFRSKLSSTFQCSKPYIDLLFSLSSFVPVDCVLDLISCTTLTVDFLSCSMSCRRLLELIVLLFSSVSEYSDYSLQFTKYFSQIFHPSVPVSIDLEQLSVPDLPSFLSILCFISSSSRLCNSSMSFVVDSLCSLNYQLIDKQGADLLSTLFVLTTNALGTVDLMEKSLLVSKFLGKFSDSIVPLPIQSQIIDAIILISNKYFLFSTFVLPCILGGYSTSFSIELLEKTMNSLLLNPVDLTIDSKFVTLVRSNSPEIHVIEHLILTCCQTNKTSALCLALFLTSFWDKKTLGIFSMCAGYFVSELKKHSFSEQFFCFILCWLADTQWVALNQAASHDVSSFLSTLTPLISPSGLKESFYQTPRVGIVLFCDKDLFI
ncbi:hypothetical protein RCL1_002027 [Eukaryota sp. TZLM3-RCL]